MGLRTSLGKEGKNTQLWGRTNHREVKDSGVT